MTFQVQNAEVGKYMQEQYSTDQIQQLLEFLKQQGTFQFPTLSSGLFSAGITSEETAYTGYQQAWVRDNIHIAHALYVTGQHQLAVQAAQALMTYFQKYRHRFEAIIANPALALQVMNRPHIRFEGQSLSELEQNWSHAQNDALGYFLWFYCKLLHEGQITPSSQELDLLTLFPQYFQAIQYWQDEDNGHWEETRKIEASSIGTVIAGLEQYQRLDSIGISDREHANISSLLTKGQAALQEILPYECRQEKNERRYDSALLFLIYPLEVIEGAIAQQIVSDVETNLKGNIGIKRYLRDSFWAPNYKQNFAPEYRTMNMSEDLILRDAHAQSGQEAQWCIFDSIISVIYGQQYLHTGKSTDLAKQTHYFNRALGQLTSANCRFGPYRCPELYYLEDQAQIPNDVTPLLWSQANLLIAFHGMHQSLIA